MRVMGRPADYSGEMADYICQQLTEGKSLLKICEEDWMPNRATVARWLAAHADFRDKYARAREVQADLLAEEVLEIANTPMIGQKRKYEQAVEHAREGDDDVEGEPDIRTVEITEGDMIEHRKLMIDARKWMAAKLAPRKYGDRVQHDHTVEVQMLSDEELYQKVVEVHAALKLPAPSKEALGLGET